MSRDTENTITTNTYGGERKQDKIVYHWLEKALRFPHLSATSFAEWLETQRIAFESEENRHALEIFLLQDEKLTEKVRNEPLIAERLRDIVRVYVKRSISHRNLSATLFWARLGVHIETHIQKALPNKEATKSFLFDILDQLEILRGKLGDVKAPQTDYPLWNHDIHLHKAYLAILGNIQDDDGVAASVKHLLLSQFSFHPHNALSPGYLISELSLHFRDQQYGRAYEEGIKKGIAQFCEAVQLKNIDEPFLEWTFSSPIASWRKDGQEYEVDLRTGVVLCEGRRLWQEAFPWNQLNAWETKQIQSVAKDLMKKGEGLFGTPDDSFIVRVSGDSIQIEKFLSFEGMRRKYVYQSRQGLHQNLPAHNTGGHMPKSHPLVQNAILWKSVTSKPHHHFYITDEHDIPIAKDIENMGTVHRVDKKGCLIDSNHPITAIFSPSNDPVPSWLSLIDEIASRDTVLFWQQNNKLHSITIPPGEDPLHFRIVEIEGEQRLACENLGGEYLLVPQQDRAFVGHIPGSLLLESKDPSQPRMMILPGKKLQVQGSLLTDDAVEVAETFILPAKKQSTYYFYEIDEKTKELHSSSNEAMLYLVYTLLQTGEYQRAEEVIRHFQCTHFFSSREQNLMCAIFQDVKKDHTPSSIALRCQLAIFLDQTERLSRAQQKTFSWIEETKKQLDKLLGSLLSEYITLEGRNRYNPIPHTLRLTRREKKRLIEWVTQGDLTKISLYPHLVVEYQLLQKGTVEQENQSISIQDEIETWLYAYQKEDFQNIHYPVTQLRVPQSIGLRSTEHALDNDYFNLLQKIQKDSKQQDPSIDQDLLTLYLESDPKNADAISRLRLLFIIRKNPAAALDLRQSYANYVWQKQKKYYNNKGKDDDVYKNRLEKSVQQFILAEKKTPSLNSASNQHSSIRMVSQDKFVRNGHRHSSFPTKMASPSQKNPCQDLVNRYFSPPQERPASPIAKENFVLSQKNSVVQSDSFSAAIHQQLLDAHKTNQEKTYLSYSLQGHSDDLIAALQTKKEHIQKNMEALQKGIETAVNGRDFLHRIEQRGQQIPTLTVHDLIFNPYHIQIELLAEQKKTTLHKNLLDFMILGVQLDQIEKARVATTKGNLQEAAEILAIKREYNPYEDPELLQYEYFSGNQLRTQPDQAKILKEIFNRIFSNDPSLEKSAALRKLFFEFQAGGGKTKVLSTIIALRALHEEKQPVFFSLPDLHDVAKSDLRDSLSRYLKVKLNVIELTLLDKPDKDQLEAILQQVRRSKKEQRCDVITPEAWHCLHLNYQEAHILNDIERLPILTDILHHYREHGVFLIDESHVNLDSLLRSNIAFGDLIPLEEQEQKLYLDVWKALMGKGKTALMKDGKPLCHSLGTDRDILGILKNEQALHAKKHLPAIQQALVSFVLDHPSMSSLDAGHKADLANYFTDLAQDPPQWLSDLYAKEEGKSFAKVCGLVRGIVHSILPHAAGMVHLMDYGRSIRKDDPLDSPWENKKPLTSKFESIDITTTLTIQGIYQRGLQTDQMRALITNITEEYQRIVAEEKYNDIEEIPMYQVFLSWQKECDEKDRISVTQITEEWLKKDENVDLLVQRFGKKSPTINRFLLQEALPAAQMLRQKMTSTAADLADGSFAMICFSATLGPHEKYPFLPEANEQFLEDAPFVADVIHRSCSQGSEEIHRDIALGSPKDLFEQLFTKNPSSWRKIEGWLNVGGFAKEVDSEEAAVQFLDFAREKNLDFAGAVYFKKVDNEKVLFLRKKGENRELDEEIRLEGSNLAKELPKHGVQGKKIFKIYGPSETTGTDLILSPSAKMILTMGEGVTMSRLAQAIMRMRKFLLAIEKWDESQRLIWVVPKVLKEKIQDDLQLDTNTDISPMDIWNWTIVNEGKLQKEAIWACSTQEIEFLFRQMIRLHLDEATRAKNWEVRNQLWERHKKAFALTCERDPFLLWGTAKKDVTTREFLLEYAKNLSEQCGIPLDQFPSIKNSLNKIIEQTEKLIQTVSVHSSQSGSGRIQQKQREQQKEKQKQQTKQKENYGSPLVYNELPYAQNEWSLQQDWKAPQEMPECRSANDLYGTELLSSKLFVLSNAYHTLRIEENPIHFKPYHYLLCVEQQNDKGNWERNYYLVGQCDGAAYQQQLLNGECASGRRAALFSPNGKIIQNGKGDCGIPDDAMDTILHGKDEEASSIFNSAQLLNGKAENKAYVAKLYSESIEPCKALLRKVVQGAIDREGVDKGVITSIVKEVNAEMGLDDDDWIDDLMNEEPTPIEPDKPQEKPQTPPTSKRFQPTGKTPAIRAAQFVKYLWQKSAVFRTFCFLTLGICP